MRRDSVGKWAWFPATVFIAAIGLAGCGGGGGDGGSAPAAVSPITRAGGVQGNGDSDLGYALSQTGRFVAFSSGATNLVVDDTNGVYDIFLYDPLAPTPALQTTRVSVGLGASGVQANGDSLFPSISADGTQVAFESRAENLVGPAVPTNAFSDIFVRDRTLNNTEQVSVAVGGGPTDGDSNKPSISADGRFVVFFSAATNLVAGDTNGAADVFLFDRDDTLAPFTEIVSVATGGAQGDNNSVVFGQAVSDDGNRVAFESAATTLVAGDTNGAKDVFVRDRAAGTTTRVSVDDTGAQANGESRVSAISGNGRYVVFESDATNLAANDNNGVTDIFVRDLTAGTTTRVSVIDNGAQANGASFALGSTTISDNGAIVVFESDATNLVTGDTNGVGDVFVRNTVDNTTDRLSITSTFGQPTTISTEGTVSRDGTTAAFGSFGLEYVPDNPSGFNNVYILAVP
jgi:Tol biopolymer transport system component